MITVTVVYALPGEATVREVRLTEGATVRDAIAASGIEDEFPEQRGRWAAVGIFARPVSLDRIVRDGDRVDLYRALSADPKELRRRRVR